MKLGVDIAAVVVAVIGAGLSGYFAWRAEQRAGRAERAAAQAEERAEREERRDEERLALERSAAERAARQEEREDAAMTSERIVGGQIPSEWQGRRAYRFRITNKGRAWASDVDASLIDEDDNEVSEFSYVHSRIGGLAPGDFGEVAVVVTDAERARNPLRLKVKWAGASGENEYTSRAPIPTD